MQKLIFLFFLLPTISAFSSQTAASFDRVAPNNGVYDLCGQTCPATFGGKAVTQRTSYSGDSKRPVCYTPSSFCPKNFNSEVQNAVHLRWGNPTDSKNEKPSGMGFTPIQVPDLPIGKPFAIGSLTHYNFPVNGGTADNFDLTLQFQILSGRTPLFNPIPFTFTFSVDETPNNWEQRSCGGNCPYDSKRSGCPRCPDKISLTKSVNTGTSFSIEGVSYTLALVGFGPSSGSLTTNPSFISEEGGTSTAFVFAVVSAACPKACVPNTLSPVFDLATLTCKCLCTNNTCNGDLKRQPDCTCGCPPDLCGAQSGVAPVVQNNKCICPCETAKCIAPKVGVTKVDGTCACSCPSKACPPGINVDSSCNCICNPATCTGAGMIQLPNCSCVCGRNRSFCSGAEVFDPATCSCVCRDKTCPGAPDQFQPKTPPPTCGCNCDVNALADKCNSLKRIYQYVPYVPTANNSAARCRCSDCLPGFVPSSADPNSNCTCPKTKADCPTNYELDVTTCQCRCITGAFCGNCSLNCTALGGFYALDTFRCNCTCPPNPPPCPAPTDPKATPLIFNRDTCSCRTCQAGECKCGNGVKEPGEDCDDPNDECCLNCKWKPAESECNFNKCGKCTPKANASTCVDAGSTYCPSGECFTQTCVSVNNLTRKCVQTNLDGIACGDDKNLCERRCLDAVCQNYSLIEANSKCSNKTEVPGCGDCCKYSCNPTNGKCEPNWTSLVNATCDDGDLCTDEDTCVVNPNSSRDQDKLVCQGSKKCTPERLGGQPPNFPCVSWVCSAEAGGLCLSQKNPGLPCGVNSLCRNAGNCSANGECIQPPVVCPQPSDPCKVSVCRESTGCVNANDLAHGLPCNDGDNCTINDRCQNGVCKPGVNNCNSTDNGGPNLAVPLGVTGAVVATGAAAAAFFVYKQMQGANLADPSAWGEVPSSQFDSNPMYQEQTQYGQNLLYTGK